MRQMEITPAPEYALPCAQIRLCMGKQRYVSFWKDEKRQKRLEFLSSCTECHMNKKEPTAFYELLHQWHRLYPSIVLDGSNVNLDDLVLRIILSRDCLGCCGDSNPHSTPGAYLDTIRERTVTRTIRIDASTLSRLLQSVREYFVARHRSTLLP